ncbi:MAG: Com family DNA-binding transcriptional regulator [Zoogloeaceae bacterium]|nr:Com family DNA-binding transcriptional regulator [Zoogloeaceae bacterium]
MAASRREPCDQPRRRAARTAGRRLSRQEFCVEEIRCGGCNRKLAEADYLRLAIKCPRCKAMNRFHFAGHELHPLSDCERQTHGVQHGNQQIRHP